MSRVTVYHLTLPRRLPLIEEEGLRTRADLTGLLGPIDELDAAAPGLFARGKRVSGWLSEPFARSTVVRHGAGLVSYTVDPRKTLAATASARDGDPEAYWRAARPLADWLADDTCPEDLEVHQNVGVRAKHVRLHTPLFDAGDLGPWAALVDEVADADRLSAKALMHLAIIASDGDFDGVEFRAACALAWRDEPDPASLQRELVETDPDQVASTALVSYGEQAGDVAAHLRDVLDETRAWSEEAGFDAGSGLLERSATVLDLMERAR